MPQEVDNEEAESDFSDIQSKSVSIGTVDHMSVPEPSLLFSPTSYSQQVTLIDHLQFVHLVPTLGVEADPIEVNCTFVC